MRRSATQSYLVLGAVTAASVWLVLALGARIEAPPHLAGPFHVNWEWEIIPPRGHRLPRQVQIDQSGVFVTVTAGDQIVSRGRLYPDGAADGHKTYRYRRDSERWPLDIREVAPERLTLVLGNRTGHATRDPHAERQARPAPATFPTTAPSGRAASVAARPQGGKTAAPGRAPAGEPTPDAGAVAAPEAEPILDDSPADP